MSTPSTMRAVVFANDGAPTLRDNVAVPKPKAGQALVKVEAAGLNPVDYKIFALSGPLSFFLRGKIMATDFAGTVVDSKSPLLQNGDRVFGLCESGSLAQFCVASDKRVAKLPNSVSSATAASLPVAAHTALDMFKAAGTKAGDGVAVVGASGGVGSMAVQIARLLGATRVACVCSGANSAAVRSLGATETVDYKSGDDAVVSSLSSPPLDSVIDCVTSPDDKDYGPIAAKCLKPGGMHVTINGPIFDFVRSALSTATGVQFQPAQRRMVLCDVNEPGLSRLAGWVADGKLRPVIEQTVAFTQADVAAAYDKLHTRRVKGKLVVAVGDTAAGVK